MTVVDPELGDISINGEPYRILLESWRVKDIVDFAPRAATPGGSVIHSELGILQPYLMTDWRHGFGFQWHTDPMGYLATTGEMDTRHPGIVMRMTTATSSDTANQPKEGLTVFNGAAYAWGTGGSTVSGLRKFNGSSWADIAQAAGGDYGTVNFALATRDYLFIFPDGARVEKLSTSDAASVTGVNASSTDYRWSIIHGGFIYAGKDNSSIIFRDDQSDLSTLPGDVVDDTDEIIIGGLLPTIGALSLWGRLFVSRQDGLWEIGQDLVARKVLDYSGEVSSANFRSMAVFNNKIIFPIRDALYMWNGASLSEITPPPLTDTFPYTTYGRFDNFVSVGRYFYCTARTNEATYNEHILAFDGTGWHKLNDGFTSSDTISMMAYDVQNNYLWFHEDDASADQTWYIPLQNFSDYPKAAFKTSGTHNLLSPRIDMGFRRIQKSTPSMFIEASNVTSARYLVVYYSLNGGSFTEWGGSGNGRITSNGVTELVNPLGTANSTIEYYYLKLRIDFVTDSGTQSPILEGITLRFILRPNVLYGHFFTIPASDRMRVGNSFADRTARDIYSALETARASVSPITFVDPMGESHQGYLSSIERRAITRHGLETREDFPDIENAITVNFVEIS